MVGAGAAIAIMRRQEREVRGDFRRAGALGPQSARSLADVGLGESRPVKRLMRHAVVRESNPGMYYFDEEVYESVRSMRRRIVFVIVGAAMVFAALGMYSATAFH